MSDTPTPEQQEIEYLLAAIEESKALSRIIEQLNKALQTAIDARGGNDA
jgi:hypothetical protein